MAKWDSKLWPLASWVELAKLLAAQGLRLAITGSKEDRQVGRFIAKRAGLGAGLADLAGRTGLKDLAALLSLARAVVSTDTGVMHLAAALGAPVVALFGPTAPWRTGPFGPGHRVLTAGVECSPCFERFCAEARCMEQITPQQAAEAALALVAER
jgi:heptosyltransferase-1